LGDEPELRNDMKPYWDNGVVRLYQGDARALPLEDESVHCVVTSPPYWGLRDYGIEPSVWGGIDHAHEWGEEQVSTATLGATLGGPSSTLTNWAGSHEPAKVYAEKAQTTNVSQGSFCPCGAWLGTLGLEPTPELYVQHIVEVMREVRRVMRSDATCWLNLGDSYAGSWGAQSRPNDNDVGSNPEGGSMLSARQIEAHPKGQTHTGSLKNTPGLKPKDLVGVPWRVALALQADGWWLRSDIIWNKPNPMPESVQGSHFTRHRVTIEEYEKLSSLRRERSSGQDRTGDMPDVSAGEIPDRQEALSKEPEGGSDNTGTRRARGRAGEAPSALSSGVGATSENSPERDGTSREQEAGRRAVSPITEEQGQETQGLRQAKSGDSAGPPSNRRGLAGDSGGTQEPLPLLQETENSDDRPRHPFEQGGEAREGESRPSVQGVQLGEEQQDNQALVDCPGCSKCKDGYIFRLSAGRPTTAHEHVFLLTKAATYFYDSDAIREPHAEPWRGTGRLESTTPHSHRKDGDERGLNRQPVFVPARREYNPAGRNKRSVWEIATEPYPDAHFATFPEALVRPCILAGTSERGVCPECGAPWERVVERDSVEQTGVTPKQQGYRDQGLASGKSTIGRTKAWEPGEGSTTTTGWAPGCTCGREDTIPATCLDVFAGACTTALVAQKLGRRAVGVDLKPEYLAMGIKRLEAVALPMVLA
jgi:DNA modification methylase